MFLSMNADTFNGDDDDPTSGFEDITFQSITKACALATHQLTHFSIPRDKIHIAFPPTPFDYFKK